MSSMWSELQGMIRTTISLFDTPTPIKRNDMLVSLAGSFNASRSWATRMQPDLEPSLPAMIDINAELDSTAPLLDHTAIVLRFKNLSSILQARSL